MWFRRFRAWLARDTRRRLLLWATLVSLACGEVYLGEPLENRLRSLRNSLHKHDTGGQIVVVGIDDKSLQALGEWPWPRGKLASLIDKARVTGAHSINVNLDLSTPSSPQDDAALADAIARAGDKVSLAMILTSDGSSGKPKAVMPLPIFRQRAELVNANVWRGAFGEVWKLFYAMNVDGLPRRSLAARLAGVFGPADMAFQIDHSIERQSIPAVSAVDLLLSKTVQDGLRNKDVVIGLTSERLGNLLVMPSGGYVPNVFFHVLGAETLRQGKQISPGWLPPLVLTLLLAVGQLYVKRLKVSLWGPALAGLLLLAAPVILEEHLVFVEVVPAILLLTIITIAQTWMAFRERSVRLNAVSGLPNLNALRQHDDSSEASLVTAKVLNFAEILAALPTDSEAELVSQIAARFSLGLNGADLHQGDDGIFAWFARHDPSIAMGDQLEGLHALFTSPATVAGRQIDLSIVFGIDRDAARSPANRIASALVAAGEAAESGLKWKIYDPAKLEEASWRLSLLGRLDTAIDNGEIWVAYQPKLDLQSRRIVGAEALARWSHPEKGDIPPIEFIGAAEQHNRIHKLTFRILEEAVQAGAVINAHGIDFDVAVNLSTRLLDSATIGKKIIQCVQENGLSPTKLTLEITESAELGSGSRSLETLRELAAQGIKLSIDDYGTGFSTLEYLRDIPATEIKIDRSFVSTMDRNHNDKMMVNSTIQLAHSLGRKAVAEGVEHAETLEMLAAMRCDVAQGYLIGRPMKFIRLSRLLLSQQLQQAA